MIHLRFHAAFCVCALAFLPSHGASQPQTRFIPELRMPAVVLDRVEGNWEVTTTDPRTPGQATVARISLWKDRQLLNNGSTTKANGDFSAGHTPNFWSWRRVNDSNWNGVPPGALTFFADGSIALKGYGKRVTTLRPTSGTVMRGRWKDGEISGDETWRRLVPRITAVEFIGIVTDRAAPNQRPGRLRVNYDGSDGMRGNKQAFSVKIWGENLGGVHHAWIEGGDIEAYALKLIRTPASGDPYIQNMDFGGKDSVTGRFMEGYVWSKITPGIKRLHFDHITIPFELEVEGMPKTDADPGAGRRDPLALDGEQVISLSLDPKSGEMRIVRRNADGSTTITHGQRTLMPDGSERIVELDELGNRRETTIAPDGSIAIARADDRATKIITTFKPDGSVDTLEHEAGGDLTSSHRGPDGSVTTVKRDRAGKLIGTTTSHPDGLLERTDPEGNLTSVTTDGSGRTTAVSADRDGNILTVVSDRDGVEEHRERIVNKALVPGRAYFEDVLKGSDWNALPDSLKHRYADSETQLRQTALRHAEEDAAVAKQRVEEAARETGDAATRGQTAEKLAAIRAEQAAADARVAAAHADDERGRQVAKSIETGKNLQRQYYEALAAGDLAKADLIGGFQAAHEAATMDLMRMTPAENQEMLRAAGVREALARKIAERAAPDAAGEAVYREGVQNTKDRITSGTRFVSVGSQMQHETAATSRSADRQQADAQAKLAQIDRLLNDSATTKEERKMLEEMRDSSSIQEEGAAELLAANRRISAAGYAIDAALIVSGGAVARGASRAIGGAVAAIAGEGAERATVAVTTRAAEVAATNVSDAARIVREAAAGRTAAAETRGATAAASEAVAPRSPSPIRPAQGRYTPEELEALHQPGRNLTAEEIQRKADLYLQRARTQQAAVRDIIDGKPASAIEGSAAEYRNINNAINDARAAHGLPPIAQPRAPVAGPARSLLPPVAEAKPVGAASPPVGASTVIERPPTVTSATGSTTETALTSSRPAPGRASRPFTAEELESMHQPGKNMTAAESLRKGELYEMRAHAQRTAVEAAAEGRSAAEFEQAAGEFRKLNDAINQARAAHGLPPIYPPPPPVAGNARSLLAPAREIPAGRASAAPTPREPGATTIIEPAGPTGTERILPSPRTASARDAGLSTIIEPAGPTGTTRLPAARSAPAPARATPPPPVATAPPPPPPPLRYIPPSFQAPSVVGTPQETERVGNLMRREWERILLRRDVNQLPGRTNEAANALLKFGDEARFPSGPNDVKNFGETMGKIARSPDGKVLTVTRSHFREGVVTNTTVETVPLENAPVDFQLQPGKQIDFIYSNVSPAGG